MQRMEMKANILKYVNIAFVMLNNFWIQANDPASPHRILSVENLEMNTENISRQQKKWESNERATKIANLILEHT